MAFTKEQALEELKRREKQRARNELERRGAPVPAKKEERFGPPSPGYSSAEQAYVAKEAPTRQALGASMGRGVQNIGLGALRLMSEASGDPTFKKLIADEIASEKRLFDPLERQRPVASIAGQAVGESVLPIGGGPGKTLGGRLVSSVVGGAAGGGLSAAGRGETASGVAREAAIGGAFGPVAEAAMGVARVLGRKAIGPFKELLRRSPIPAEQFFDASGNLTRQAMDEIESTGVTEQEFKDIFEPVLRGITDPPTEGLPADAALRQVRAQGVGVDLSAGQMTRDFRTFTDEEILRSTATPEGIEAQGFFKGQQADLITAKANFLESLGAEIDITKEQRGEVVKTSLQKLKDAEKDNISRLYKEFGDLPGGGKVMDQTELINKFDDLVAEYGGSQSLEKTFDNILNDFKIKDDFKINRRTKDFTIANSEAFRKRLNKLPANQNEDYSIIGQLKETFDGMVLREAENQSDEALIAAAQKARRAAAEMYDKWGQKDIVEELVSYKKGTKTDKIPPSRVFDVLFSGSNKAENINRVKKILTTNGTRDSVAQWKSIQTQGAMDVLGKAISETPDGFTMSGAKLNSEVKRFGEDNLKKLLGDPAYKQFKSLQAVLGDATIPVPRTQNPSGTAIRVFNQLAKMVPMHRIGFLDKGIQLAGTGINAVKEASSRRTVLDGITKGATPEQQGKAYWEMIVQNSINRGLARDNDE